MKQYEIDTTIQLVKVNGEVVASLVNSIVAPVEIKGLTLEELALFSSTGAIHLVKDGD